MTMLKAQYDRRGPAPHEVIRAVPLELPSPAAGQTLVAMLASPINPANLLTLTGQYAVLPPLPAVGGTEGVGRIAALGESVNGPPLSYARPPAGDLFKDALNSFSEKADRNLM